MTDILTEQDLEALWNESDDDGATLPPSTTDDETDPNEPSDGDEGQTDEGDDEGEGDAGDGEQPGEGEPEVLDYKALYEAASTAIKSSDGRARAAEARLKQEIERQAGVTPTAPVAPAANEDDEFLQKFRTEYSEDVVKAIDLITSKKASQLIETTLAGRLAPIEQSTQDMLANAHFAAIEAAHPDIDEINASPAFDAWLDSRPAHVKGAYAYVREQGTPAEVISMLNEYKGAMKPQTPASTVPASRVAAAVGVQRRRGTAPTSAAPEQSDLQAIWNETND